MRRVWIISDLQVPYHDRKAVDAVAQAIADMKGPDDLVATAGDEMDFQTISRWSQGTALEWERSIGKHPSGLERPTGASVHQVQPHSQALQLHDEAPARFDRAT
jgi:hypothetical protein